MDKLIIQAKLKTPFIKVGFMTLDGLLAALKFDELKDVEQAHQSIPLKNTQGLFHASAALFEPIEISKEVFIAALHEQHSIDPDLILKKSNGQLHRKFDSSFTNVLNTYKKVTASKITWYAEGDADEIQRLLSPVSFIGKRRASGFGEVESWSFERGDLDGILGNFDEPLRPIPIEMFQGDKEAYPIMDAAWKPAYWDVMNRRACYAPALED